MTGEPLEPILRLLKKGPRQLLAHSLAVACLVERMLPRLPACGGLDGRALILGALAHDAGKLTWPGELFAKRSLSDRDWALIKAHPAAGESLLREAWPGAPEAVLEVVARHHERPGSRGYPRGAEPSYPVLAVAAADVICAMTAHLPYRPALPLDKALEEIARWAPPEVAAAAEEAALGLELERLWRRATAGAV